MINETIQEKGEEDYVDLDVFIRRLEEEKARRASGEEE